MWNTTARQKLEDKRKDLIQWRADVPKRAQRFHVISEELRRQIDEALPRWRVWVDGQEITRYEQRAARMQDLVDPLRALICHIETLEADVQRVCDAGSDLSAELIAWLIKRCIDWKIRLDRLGKNCERLADVLRDDSACVVIEGEIAVTREAVYQLREAERIAATLAANVRAAELIANLPQLRARLFAKTATHEWVEELKRLVEPVKPLADRIDDPPPEFIALATLLTELRGWARHLGESDSEIQLLEQRKFKAVDWEPAEVQNLVEDAQRLRDRFVDQAEQQRSMLLRDIEDAIADLRQARGEQPEIDERLLALRSRAFGRPQAFREWLEQLQKFRQFFNAIAQTHIGALDARLREVVSRVEKKLEELTGRPLSEETGNEAVLLRRELSAFPQGLTVEEILLQLRRINKLELQIDALIRRAEQDLSEIQRLQEQLAAQSAVLQSEAQRVQDLHIDMADLTGQIAKLAAIAQDESLETRHRRIAFLASELETITAQFIGQCRERVADELSIAHNVSDALRRAGMAQLPSAPPTLGESATADEAAQALLDARQFGDILRKKARKLRKELENRLREAAEELRKLPLDDLAPGDRQTAAQLILDIGAGVPNGSLSERIGLLTALVGRRDQFLDRLLQEERSARDQLKELRLRFHKFNEEQLDRAFPDLVAHVAALIYGIPEEPRFWPPVSHQLDLVTTLFGHVEAQACRVAAEDLHHARLTLRRLPDAETDASIKQLLAELDECGDEVLPPIALRLRVLNLSKRPV